MVVQKGRYARIDLGKRTWEMAIITRSRKFKANGQGDAEPEEKTTRFSGRTTAEGRLKLYEKLEAGDKAVLEAGNMAFIMAKEMEKIVGCQARVLNPYRLAVIYATDKKTDKEDALKLAHLVTDRPDSRLPVVAVPGDEETERRKPVSSYRRERKARVQEINRPRAAFVHTGITTAVKKDLKTDEARRGNGAQAGNYLGLMPRVYMSGSLIRYGGITKRGNGYLRALPVQGSRALVRPKDGGALKERFEYMTKEKGTGKKKATAAIARRLGVLLYTLLKNGPVYEARRFRPGKPADVTDLVQETLSA
jgi:transposase